VTAVREHNEIRGQVVVSQERDPQTGMDKLSVQVTEEHKMASIGRLLAGIVHEINTPIGSIVSNNQVIMRALEMVKQALAEPQPASLDKAKGVIDTCISLAAVDKIACERILEVIRGLKTFARVDSSELRKTDLNEQIRNTLKLTHGEFRRRVQVETDLGDIPPVECYPHMLNQVFLNILVNAGQAIEGEGKIVVRTRRAGDFVEISISDTGHGIRPEDRSRIFAGGFTTKAVGIGTGLGLSISKKIVEETHDGSIDFESEVGRGTTFHVRLPIEQAKSRPSSSSK
jgi:two-component system NtrC family sensor kinase